MSGNKNLYVGEFGCENFKRLTMYSFRPLGGHCKISGKNGAGKSTAMDILKSVLGLIPGKELSEPIKAGATRAKAWVDLVDESGNVVWKAKETFTEKGNTIDLRKADGSKQPRPRETLESLYLPFAFAPSQWINQRPQDQLDDVLRVLGVKPPVDEVTAITGEKILPAQDESASRYLDRLSADERGLFYVRRREKNRELTVKQKAFEEFRPHLDTAPGEETDISALLAESEELAKAADHRRELVGQADAAKRVYTEKAAKLETVKSDLQKQDEVIEALRIQMEKAVARREEIAAVMALGETRVPELKHLWDAAQFAADQTPDPTPRAQQVRILIQDADKNRKAIAERQQAKETAFRLQEQATACEKEHVKLDAILEALRELRRNLLNGIDLGIEGLAIGDGELRLGDAPFVQASQSQKMLVACSIIFRQNPTLKILLFDSAELMDQETETTLLKMATENGWELFLAQVNREGGDELCTTIVDETAGAMAVATA